MTDEPGVVLDRITVRNAIKMLRHYIADLDRAEAPSWLERHLLGELHDAFVAATGTEP